MPLQCVQWTKHICVDLPMAHVQTQYLLSEVSQNSQKPVPKGRLGILYPRFTYSTVAGCMLSGGRGMGGGSWVIVQRTVLQAWIA
jgi:hypothetical protein